MSNVTKPKHDNLNAEFHASVLKSENSTKHFHDKYELIIVAEGDCNFTIGDKKFKIDRGECAFICPFQMHEVEPNDGALVWRLNFNHNIILTVAQSLNGRIPKNPKFKIEKETLNYVIWLLEGSFGWNNAESWFITPYDNRIRAKGMLYLILTDFLNSAVLVSAPKTDTIAMEIALYISNNFKNNVSLKDIAQEKGYNYQYLSRIFNKFMNMNFKTMLNHHRAQRAYAMLQDTNLPVSYVGMECGFQSIRSFNLACRDIFGKSPKEIRELRRI